MGFRFIAEVWFERNGVQNFDGRQESGDCVTLYTVFVDIKTAFDLDGLKLCLCWLMWVYAQTTGLAQGKIYIYSYLLFC